MACSCSWTSVTQNNGVGYACRYGSKVCKSEYYKVRYEWAHCFYLGSYDYQTITCNEVGTGECCSDGFGPLPPTP
ncbi:hypothetical protein D3C75_1126010 [compost metagenome]